MTSVALFVRVNNQFMPKVLLLFFLIMIPFKSFSQINEVTIIGMVKSDSLSVEGIHVLNKNSSNGTITNQFGHFQIPVKENDTLIFSGVQFYYQEILIKKELMNVKRITVNLMQKINELKEIQLKPHDLLGNLAKDAGKIKDSISKIQSSALDFSMIDFKKPVVSDIDEIDRKKPPDIRHLVDPTARLGVSAGIPLKKLQTKEEKKLEKLKEKSDIIKKIRFFVSDKYFTDSLKIPREQIDDFIEHCKSKGIIDLFNQGRKIEVIDILIKEGKIYKN